MSEELMPAHGEILLVEDERGLAVFGDPDLVEPWLASQNVTSRELPVTPARAAMVASGGLNTGASVLANSGRWVKLTEESAQLAKAAGKPLTDGVIRGKGGQIIKHVHFESLGKAAVANPGVLAGVGGVMAQVAMDQAIAEITDYLAVIDKKVDALLRDQKDQTIADLMGVAAAVEEAKVIRDATGVVSATTWSKVSHTGQSIARAQGYALSKLSRLASGLDEAKSAGETAEAAKQVSSDLQDWLVVIARACQIQDMLSVVELERVMSDDPRQLAAHTAGVNEARRRRLIGIQKAAGSLGVRIGQAATRAVDDKAIHPMAVTRTIRYLDQAAAALWNFAEHLGIEADRVEITAAPAWRTAAGELLSDTGDSVTDLGSRAADGARQLGGSAVDGAKELSSATAQRFGSAKERVAEAAPKRPGFPKWRRPDRED